MEHWIPWVVIAAATLWVLASRRGDVTGAEAHRLVEAGARLVDVRTPAEFAASHLDGAVNLPLGVLESRLHDLEPREQPIVVYCASGMRSRRAAERLRRAGFSMVRNLGPMSRW
jgi:phage shock protein E